MNIKINMYMSIIVKTTRFIIIKKRSNDANVSRRPRPLCVIRIQLQRTRDTVDNVFLGESLLINGH